MKLSEAIRRGIKLMPEQAFGTYYQYSGQKVIACDALGAAGLAADVGHMDMNPHGFAKCNVEGMMTPDRSEFLWIENPVSMKKGLMMEVIVDLNDTSRWTREQIAEWLENLGY